MVIYQRVTASKVSAKTPGSCSAGKDQYDQDSMLQKKLDTVEFDSDSSPPDKLHVIAHHKVERSALFLLERSEQSRDVP